MVRIVIVVTVVMGGMGPELGDTTVRNLFEEELEGQLPSTPNSLETLLDSLLFGACAVRPLLNPTRTE